MVLLLPFIGWIATGVVFLIKPGYEQAYAMLALKTYPLQQQYQLVPRQDWHEVRFLRTILGDHLLVRTHSQWQHLDPATLQPYPKPDHSDLVMLLDDAISAQPDRYGNVVNKSENLFLTDTGVELQLDWHTLGLTQRGRDTRLIGTLYRIHYLEWFGNRTADTILGVGALAALAALGFFGLTLMRKREEG
ncbi:MAG: hypothetical protein ACI9NT_000159 [Bacteroidia bacterium]